MTACHQFARAADKIATTGAGPRQFLLLLGKNAAGIGLGPRGYVDLLRGGSNRIRGHGIRPQYHDGTDGQIRHFAGIATTAARLGPGLTRWLSIHVRHDAAHTPDGQLTDLALDFVRALRNKSLSPGGAASWIEHHLCEPVATHDRDVGKA